MGGGWVGWEQALHLGGGIGTCTLHGLWWVGHRWARCPMSEIPPDRGSESDNDRSIQTFQLTQLTARCTEKVKCEMHRTH